MATRCEDCQIARAALVYDDGGVNIDLCGPCFRSRTSLAERKQIAAAILPPKEPMTQLQEDVLAIIRQNPGLTIVQLAAKISMPRQSAGRVVTELRKMGEVKPATSEKDPNFGRVFAMESECPATTAPVEPAATVIFDGRVDSLISDGGEKPPGDGGGGPQIAIDPAKPGSEFTAETLVIQTPAPGHFPLLERIRVPTHPEMDPSHLAALEAAKELAGENATLKAQIKEIRDLLGCDGMPEDALCHLSEVLADAKVHLPKCDRSPNCKSLHLSTRIHELADERDMYRHSHNAAAQQHSRLCKAFGRAIDPEELEAAQKAAVGIQRKLESDLGATRRFLESERRRANDAEGQLSEIDWLCDAAGFTGSGDTSDRFMWLLGHLGFDWMAAAIRQRRQIAGRIRDLGVSLQELTKRVRLGLPPETGDRCQCGGEARKVETENGFTKCDGCFYENLGVDPGEGAE